MVQSLPFVYNEGMKLFAGSDKDGGMQGAVWGWASDMAAGMAVKAVTAYCPGGEGKMCRDIAVSPAQGRCGSLALFLFHIEKAGCFGVEASSSNRLLSRSARACCGRG